MVPIPDLEGVVAVRITLGGAALLLTFAAAANGQQEAPWTMRPIGRFLSPPRAFLPIPVSPPASSEALTPSVGLEADCAACHNFPEGVTHPIGVVPTFQVPPDFPLDSAGRLTCETCHDMSVGHRNESASDSFSLRRPEAGRAFCAECHRSARLLVGSKGAGARSGRVSHAAIGETAHDGPRARASSATGGGTPVDSQSMNCLSCHDGSIGATADSEVSFDGTPANALSQGAVPVIGRSHPVGADYATATRRATLRPDSGRNPAVRLYEGKVGCGSCHSIFSGRAGMLVMDNGRSALCLECHQY
jgi:predicted CXXCH cytochrome family protein